MIVKVMATRAEMGRVAARDIHDRILALLAEKGEVNMIFPATAFATILFLALGTWIFPDSSEERKEIEKWMDGLTSR